MSGPELLMLAALLVIAGAALAFVRGSREAGPPGPSVSFEDEKSEWAPSIAVLPFADMSPEGDQEYIGDGIAEEILNALTRVPGLKVAARTSAFSFKDKDVTTQTIGQQLGVRTVLEGSVRTEGSRIKVTAQLIGVEDGFHLWSESYDRELESVFALQEEIATQVVGSLREELLGEVTSPLVTESTTDFEAYRLYLEGRAFGNRQTREGLQRAIELFKEAIERDSTFAPAYSGLSDARLALGLYGYAPRPEVLPMAREMAERALALDEGLAEAHASLARVHYAEFRWGEAEREVRLALELNPGYARAHALRGSLLSIAGRLDESLEAMRRAYALDPLSPETAAFYGALLVWARDYEAAEEYLSKALELHPDYWLTYGPLLDLYVRTGKEEQALQAAERASSLDIPSNIAGGLVWLSAWVYAVRGEPERALEGLEAAASGMIGITQEGTGAVFLARVYAALGEHDRALVWLERQTDWRWPFGPFLHWDPEFDPLRSDPRFQAVVEGMERAWGLR